MSAQLRAYTHLALAMCIAGSAVVAAKIMVATMPVFLAAELGILASLAVQLPLTFLYYREHIPRDSVTHLHLLLQAVCGVVLYRVFIFWGLQHTTAAAGGLISSATPVCIALLAVVFLGERMNRQSVLGVACVVAGLVAVSIGPVLDNLEAGEGALLGNGLVLIAVISEAAFSVMSRAKGGSMSPLGRTTMVSTYAFCCLLPFAMHDAQGFAFAELDSVSLLCIVYYGVVVSFLSYLLWFSGIAVVQAATAASFTGLVPLSSIMLSWGVLQEQITLAHVVGLACVLAGISLSCVARRRPEEL